MGSNIGGMQASSPMGQAALNAWSATAAPAAGRRSIDGRRCVLDRYRRVAGLSDSAAQLGSVRLDRVDLHPMRRQINLHPGVRVNGMDGFGDAADAMAAAHVVDSECDHLDLRWVVDGVTFILPNVGGSSDFDQHRQIGCALDLVIVGRSRLRIEAIDFPGGEYMMNIGEAASASRVSAKMIRYYEELALLPAARRTESGYRQYEPNDVHTLRFIRHSRDLGFSLAEIGELLSLWHNRRRPSRSVKALAVAHIKELEQKATQLLAMKLVLERLVHCCQGDDRPECPILDGLAQADALTPPVPATKRRALERTRQVRE